MNSILDSSIDSVKRAKTSFCKFISANDAGKTGAHQEGIYIPKNSISLMFDKPGIKGQKKDRFIKIKWQNDFETSSRFVFYGQKSRNEYRLTRFGRGFPYLTENNVGDLLIISHIDGDYYEGFVLMTDDDIEEFFATFNISSIETNRLIKRSNTVSAETELVRCFQIYLDSVKTDFPGSLNLSIQSRECYKNSFSITNTLIKSRPDETLLKWIDIEYQLFKVFENDRYGERIRVPFKTVEELIECANTILNRRKSRAGKSLEHHLAEMFGVFNLKFESQVVTEDNKRPDFIFPGSKFYRDNSFNVSNLIFLASKTTCKDRWRQILNEADRIEEKHLFTLQQGISMNQLNEMYGCKVKLVVPKPYISSYPEKFRSNIMTLNDFIGFVKSKQK